MRIHFPALILPGSIAGVLLAVAVILGGCTEVPAYPPVGDIETKRLREHVEFLAGAELKGREARSRGSRLARRYISKQFDAYDLEPWKDSDGFEQRIIVGTNVIGVLPGSDPSVADEFVVVSAHYDHLGAKHGGTIYPGAADNAGGVAAMLEIAAHLALGEERPRRPVVFAAFDAEEMGLLGAFAFTSREDFAPAHLAGLVNLDILGRHFMDVSENALLAVGTEKFPVLRETLLTAGEEAGIDILPLGRELAGPRSDHVAFEAYDAPWVFLTSGPYADYHQPTDTPEKVDYELLKRSASTAAAAVRALANAGEVERPVSQKEGDKLELAALSRLFNDVSHRPEVAGVEDEQVLARMSALAGRADEFLVNGGYTIEAREELASEVVRLMLPFLVGHELSPAGYDHTMLLQELYRYHPPLLFEGWRGTMEHILEHRPGIFRGAPAYEYRQTAVSDEVVAFEPLGDGRIRMSYSIPSLSIDLRIGAFGRSQSAITPHWSRADFTGTIDELVDFLLLGWRQEQDDSVWSAAPAIAADLLGKLTGEDYGSDYAQWISWRLAQTPYDEETSLFASRAASGRGLLRARALRVLLEVDRSAYLPYALRAMDDNDEEPFVREMIIREVNGSDGVETLGVLVDLLDDATALSPESPFLFEKEHSLFSRYSALHYRRERKEAMSNPAGEIMTVGDVALEQLEKISGRTLGFDPKAWRAWMGEAL